MTQNNDCQSTSTSTYNRGKRYPVVNSQLRGGKRKTCPLFSRASQGTQGRKEVTGKPSETKSQRVLF